MTLDRVPRSGVRENEGGRLGRSFFQAPRSSPSRTLSFEHKRPTPSAARDGSGSRSGVGSGVSTVRGRLEFGSRLDYSASGARGLSIYRERMLRLEIKIPFDAEAEAKPDRGDFGEARVTQLGGAEAGVTQTEERVTVLGIKLCQQPRRGPARVKEFDHRPVIQVEVPGIGE